MVMVLTTTWPCLAGNAHCGGMASETTSPTVAMVRTRDGLDLRTYRWPAIGAARARVLLVHGVAEHAGRYPHVGSQLARAGIETYAFDLRGFGRSGGHRAYIDQWSQYHGDVEDRIAGMRSAADGLPVVLYGHSMGGLIALGYVLADPRRPLPDLLVLSAPAIDAIVPVWKRRLADVLAITVPRFAIANTFPKGALSADPAVETAYLTDPLAVHRTTARLGVALFREQDRVKGVLARGGPLPVMTYVVHGTDDPIVPEWATRSLEGRANVTRRVYQGLHHETHNEPSGTAVIDDTIAWIIGNVAGPRR
ncbi:MAG: lysophospholipase [Chloroflexi bacterium]|nr:MAG: lysophospholipase [Chloroflexota bacterium]